MAEWTLTVSDQTDRNLRAMLESRGDMADDLSDYIERLVCAELLRHTLDQIHRRNADLTEDEAMALANEAVAWARANPA